MYVLGTHQKYLSEAPLMSILNMFSCRNDKIWTIFGWEMCLIYTYDIYSLPITSY